MGWAMPKASLWDWFGKKSKVIGERPKPKNLQPNNSQRPYAFGATQPFTLKPDLVGISMNYQKFSDSLNSNGLY
jgi:hypothetical protein